MSEVVLLAKKKSFQYKDYTNPCVGWLIPMLLVKRFSDLGWDFLLKNKNYLSKSW